MQISLRSKLDSNPNYLNEYAESVAKELKLDPSEVCSKIVDNFEESPTFVREHLDKKYKDLSKVSKQSLITRTRNKIESLQKELSISEAIYESLVFSKK